MPVSETMPTTALPTLVSPAVRRSGRVVLLLMALFVIVFSVFTIGRYARYNATGFDLAFYDQILWRTAHGDVMGLTIEGDHWTNWAFHVEPILLLIAPFTRIFSDTRWLLILQTVVLAVGAVPVYRIARREWPNPWISTLFAALYLLYPTIGWADKFDFHPITLTTPLLLFAFDSAELKRWRLTSILLLLAMLCKEEVGFLVAIFGLYWYLSPVRWRGGLIWLIIGIGWTLIGFFVIIPAAQGKLFLPDQADLRYAWLFHGTLSDKLAYLTGPDTPVKIRFLIQLFAPLAFTSLLKPRILAIAAPIVGLSLLSTRISQSSVYHHYMADVVPFLLIASIKGTHELPTLLRKIGARMRPVSVQRAILIAMSTATALLFVIFNPFTFIPREPYAPIYGWESGASLDGLNAVGALIPADACLTTSNNIAAHYGQRTYLYVVGIGNYTECDRVLIDLADRRFQEFGSPNAYACKVFNAQNFHPLFYQDHVVLLQKDVPPQAALDQQMATFCAQSP